MSQSLLVVTESSGRMLGNIPSAALETINLADLDQIIFTADSTNHQTDVWGSFYREGNMIVAQEQWYSERR